MKAVVYSKYGGPEVLEHKDIETPVPGDGEVLVRVHATALNAYDWHMLTADIFLVLFGRPGFEYRLRQQLGSPIGRPYDVVIFDCPPAFGTLTMNALTAADLLLIPVPCDYFSARSLQQFLELVNLVQHNTNPALRYRILITMFDKRNRISHIIQDQVRRKYGNIVFNTIISVDTKLRESPVIGQPITQYAPHSRSTQEYHALATGVDAR